MCSQSTYVHCVVSYVLVSTVLIGPGSVAMCYTGSRKGVAPREDHLPAEREGKIDTHPGNMAGWQDVMRQGKLLRSDALTCGPPKLDDDCWSPEGLGLVRSSARIFIACPGEHACRAAQLYADGEAHMYMLSAHQQIEPARPPITSRQARNQGKRASRGQGAWSFARRGRFKIAARVGRIPQRRPGRWLLL